MTENQYVNQPAGVVGSEQQNSRTYSPKEGYEGMEVTLNVRGETKDFDSWPLTTNDGTIQRLLDAITWLDSEGQQQAGIATDATGYSTVSKNLSSTRIGAANEVIDPTMPVEQQQERGAQVTEAAAKKAAEMGVDLAHVTGTGADGRIVNEDVERAAAERQPDGDNEEEE